MAKTLFDLILLYFRDYYILASVYVASAMLQPFVCTKACYEIGLH